MTTPTPSLTLFMNMAIAQAIVGRRFDPQLGGLSFTEFLILYHLSKNPTGKMRRVDLAERIGLTASGVTRLLAPMEKIGLVKREENTADARVSFVALAPSGKRMLNESMEHADYLATQLLTNCTKDEVRHASEVMLKLGGTVR